MPGNKIDVYLQSLIKELNELWAKGVETYDSSLKEVFKMCAALMWTISDFPGLCNLSGWNTYIGYACPTCNFDALTCRLSSSNKWCFMGHRRFLERGHKFRLMKRHFDGSIEERGAPKLLSGLDILKQLDDMNVTSEKILESSIKGEQWRKRSIFFNLPYWKDNLLCHNLDVMYIEKNVCDNVLYTMINAEKSKDHLEARNDLKDMEIKEDLWPDENGIYLPLLFTMTKRTKKVFSQYIEECKDARWVLK